MTELPEGFEVRSIRPEEREECLQLWCDTWPSQHNRAYFERYFYGDVEWLPYYTQVGLLGGRIVAAVHIVKRIVACAEFSLTIGGIANVATRAEYRGRGFNSACLKSAVGIMEADAMDFSLLFTGINDYYRRFGFSTLPMRRRDGAIRPQFTPRPNAYRVRDAGAADIPMLRRPCLRYD